MLNPSNILIDSVSISNISVDIFIISFELIGVDTEPDIRISVQVQTY